MRRRKNYEAVCINRAGTEAVRALCDFTVSSAASALDAINGHHRAEYASKTLPKETHPIMVVTSDRGFVKRRRIVAAPDDLINFLGKSVSTLMKAVQDNPDWVSIELMGECPCCSHKTEKQ